MHRTLFVGAGLITALAAAPATADAQVSLPIQIGLSGGAAFPTGELGRNDAVGTGWGFEVNGVLDVASALGIYAAYDRYAFEIEQGGVFGIGGAAGDVVDQGFAGGVMLTVPSAGLGLGPWIRGGAVYNTLQFDYDNFEDDPESDPGLGFEVGAGLDFPLGFVASMTPSVRYRSYEPDFGGTDDPDVSYVVGELGLTFRF